MAKISFEDLHPRKHYSNFPHVGVHQWVAYRKMLLQRPWLTFFFLLFTSLGQEKHWWMTPKQPLQLPLLFAIAPFSPLSLSHLNRLHLSVAKVVSKSIKSIWHINKLFLTFFSFNFCIQLYHKNIYVSNILIDQKKNISLNALMSYLQRRREFLLSSTII
jgi:hypothetical protein